MIFALVGCVLDRAPAPLKDPIPAKIEKGNIVVKAVEFVRAPKTDDPAHPEYTNDAYARIQYLQPIPDGSGRLAFSDVRGLLYITDMDGAQPQVYLDIRSRPVDFYNNAFPNEAGLLGFAFHPQFRRGRQAGLRQVLHGVQRGPRQRHSRLSRRKRRKPGKRNLRVDG